METPTVFFAIPAMEEPELGRTLECVAKQDYPGPMKVAVCVNQPQSDYETSVHAERTACNAATWDQLQQNPWKLELIPIDRFSPGKAWTGKNTGVGIARQTCVGALLPFASDSDILISMDADTLFDTDYVTRIVEIFQRNRKTIAVNPPYHHFLSGNESQDRAMLRYEIYMRTFLIQLLRIASPYAFTALGSAICCRIGNYRKVGGFDARQAGEDFYFLQKIVKSGHLEVAADCCVYPSSRLSERVPFGTGPAIRDLQQAHPTNRYPLFSPQAFDAIAESYRLIPELQKGPVSTPLTDFMDQTSGQNGIWDKLRKNYPGLDAFAKAFHQKADGLRIFQFLRHYAATHPTSDEELLKRLAPSLLLPSDFCFNTAPLSLLEEIRLHLEATEIRSRNKQSEK